MPGAQELLVIAVVALLVFGPDRLPEVMRKAAQLLARFREASQQSIDELKRAAELDDVGRELRDLGDEVRGATSSVQREFRETTDSATRQLRGGEPLRSGSDGGADAADHAPPPMDPEAT